MHILKKILFVHERHTERERQRHRQRERQAPHGDPDVGLDSRTPGSCHEPKADTKPLSHPGIPQATLLKYSFLTFHRKQSQLHGFKTRVII